MKKKAAIIMLACLASMCSFAQTRQQMGGVYHAYPKAEAKEVWKSPVGYSPFYISHYGRHGSRWMTSDERYLWVNSHFCDDANLTVLGEKVKSLLQRVYDNARGHGGRLTKLGQRQHQGIAKRMVRNFPQVFAKGNRVSARSSVVDRCRKSMLAFTDEMHRLCPSLTLDVRTDSADMAWIAYTSPDEKNLENRTKVAAKVTTDRFMSQLFKDVSKIDDPVKLMGEIHTIASSIQDVGLDFKSYPKDIEKGLNALFTDEEFKAFYDANNLRMTICNGNLTANEGIPARSAVSLWQNIEAEADKALVADKPSATLRFGHDTSLYRLLSLLSPVIVLGKNLSDVEDGAPWVRVGNADMMDRIVPMAANLQMVFYKSNAPSENVADDVLVKIILNENDKAAPLKLQPWHDGEYGNVYRWTDMKAYMQKRIHNLEHIRQLHALNTMVGTAQANTHTAGMFGKGSEEHGQTLPAVLVPNGQNFWTPQTQDTEKKCIAPYYYKDAELQGFRNSHWIVGGCTQDYGSFTVATLGGKLRLQPEERATPFSHEDEISHPNYYSVDLKAEHLKTELTALSHTAIFRVTPDEDELVHIVVNPNSDEGEGYIEVDTLRHIVYGYNPVHRIYQGWGEPAGFSGHFVLQYTDGLAGFGTFQADGKYEHIASTGCKPRIGAWLTFKGKAGVPMEIYASSSFTSKEKALENLALEAYAVGESPGFDGMRTLAEGIWCERLHRIDVESTDTAKIDQFYGAFYRASFLPREMSDVCGDYPMFAIGKTLKIDSPRPQAEKQMNSSLFTLNSSLPTDSSLSTLRSSLKSYGDFSMWDIYRAELPLYNIITPSMSGNMMQSLVNMADEGGWLPIFPCWNSYTAAMIGDHASVALADAYVKGVRNFDVQKAYRYMRKNAFESPATAEEYKNGMGRRALQSYLKYGYIPLEDSVKEAFHTNEQTSRTLEYAFDDYAVAQMAKALGHNDDYETLMQRSRNWKNVINPSTGWADGRHADGTWLGCRDLVSRQSFITEGSICHYSWYVPHDVEELIERMGGKERFEQKLDRMFAMDTVSAGTRQLYWHGNEPCHQIPFLYSYIGRPDKTKKIVGNILATEYNDTPGGLSGNDDAGQMSAWYMFAAMGIYPLCPSTPYYIIGAPDFDRVVMNLENGRRFEIVATGGDADGGSLPLSLNGQPYRSFRLSHKDILDGGRLIMTK